jgi:uncharacterized DUF497 family protein
MNYTASLNFEWDESKSQACFAERGFDFAYVTRCESSRRAKPIYES